MNQMTRTQSKGVPIRKIALSSGLVVALASLAFLARANLLKSAPEETLTTEPLPVVTAMPRDIRQVIKVSGEFRPYQEADLDAKVRGYVQKLYNDVGDVVKKGTVLGVLEVPELKDELLSADAAVAVAEQQTEKARAQYEDDKVISDRLQGVAKERPELIAQQELDQAKARSDASLAAFTAAQASVKQALANRTQVRDTDAYSKIYAPYDGVITRRYVDEGALVGAASGGTGNAVFHISEVKRLRLVVMVPESSVPDIVVGRKAQVSTAALDQKVDLPVSRISHQLDETTRTMHVELDFDNRSGKVAPGMYAEVSLPLKERDHVLTVPLTALRTRQDNRATVYVLLNNGHVAPRQVEVGLEGSENIEITSGIEAGELVVVDVTPQTDTAVKYVPKRLDQG
jgi:RND family efflux transporter MFP subunit